MHQPGIDFSKTWKALNSGLLLPYTHDLSFLAAHNVLPTHDLLYKYGITRLVGCLFCREKESIKHLFYDCHVVAPLIEFISDLLSTAVNVMTLNFTNIIYFNDIPAFFDDSSMKLFIILVSEAKYIIWSVRNEAKFNKKYVDATVLKTFYIHNIKRRIKLDYERLTLSSF